MLPVCAAPIGAPVLRAFDGRDRRETLELDTERATAHDADPRRVPALANPSPFQLSALAFVRGADPQARRTLTQAAVAPTELQRRATALGKAPARLSLDAVAKLGIAAAPPSRRAATTRAPQRTAEASGALSGVPRKYAKLGAEHGFPGPPSRRRGRRDVRPLPARGARRRRSR